MKRPTTDRRATPPATVLPDVSRYMPKDSWWTCDRATFRERIEKTEQERMVKSRFGQATSLELDINYADPRTRVRPAADPIPKPPSRGLPRCP